MRVSIYWSECGWQVAMLGREYRSQKWRICEIGFVEAKVRGRLFEVARVIIGDSYTQTGNLGSHN